MYNEDHIDFFIKPIANFKNILTVKNGKDKALNIKVNR